MSNTKCYCRAFLRKHHLTASHLIEIVDIGDLAHYLKVVKA